jgi:hypothetical protein
MIGKALLFLTLICLSFGLEKPLDKNEQKNLKLDLSSIMNLLPGSNNNLGGLNTSGMSLSDIMKLLQLIKQLNDLKDQVTAIPQDVLNALNATSILLTQQGFNLTQLTQHEVAGKRGYYFIF